MSNENNKVKLKVTSKSDTSKTEKATKHKNIAVIILSITTAILAITSTALLCMHINSQYQEKQQQEQISELRDENEKLEHSRDVWKGISEDWKEKYYDCLFDYEHLL